MQIKAVIRSTAYVVGAVWSVAAAIAGFQFDDLPKRLLGLLPLVVVLLFTAWDLWLWRWRPLVGLSGRPDLNGTWLGEYRAEWVDAATERHNKTAPAALSIKQTFTTLSIVLMTSESKSYSIFASVTKLESGEFRVNYEYDNTPHADYRDKMPRHTGSAQLVVASARSGKLSGEYWTNRLSRGALQFEWRSSSSTSTLDAAQTLADRSSERSS